MGKAMATMQITELLKPAPCEYTIVEWSRRAAIQDEIALSRTEFIDPAARIEDGHLIDPEILIRGRIEDRPGTPARVALIAWLVDAKTGVKLSGEVSSVTLTDAFFANVRRLGELIQRDLICARANVVPPAPPATTEPAPAPTPPPSPPVPTAATNVYTGTFSGEAYSRGSGSALDLDRDGAPGRRVGLVAALPAAQRRAAGQLPDVHA